jgi:hypothetical protein
MASKNYGTVIRINAKNQQRARKVATNSIPPSTVSAIVNYCMERTLPELERGLIATKESKMKG